MYKRQRLDQHAAAMGERLCAHLQALQARYPQIGEVRGRGLMLGVEMVDPQGRADAMGHAPHKMCIRDSYCPTASWTGRVCRSRR